MFTLAEQTFYFLGNGANIKNYDLFNELKKTYPVVPNSAASKNTLLQYTLGVLGLETWKNKYIIRYLKRCIPFVHRPPGIG